MRILQETHSPDPFILPMFVEAFKLSFWYLITDVNIYIKYPVFSMCGTKLIIVDLVQ